METNKKNLGKINTQRCSVTLMKKNLLRNCSNSTGNKCIFFAEDRNDMWNAKKDYYSSKIAGQKFNPKKARKSMNNLLGKQNKQTVVNEINLEGKKLQLSKILQRALLITFQILALIYE
jgi:hypothetical protein